MNKKTLRITGWALGLSMAVAGIGLAVNASAKAPIETRAGESVTTTYTLDGSISGGTNAYASASEITQSGVSWSATGNTTTDPWRIGGKSLTNENRAIYSTTAIAGKVNRISVTSGTSTLTSVNSLTITVHDSAAEAADGSDAKATKTVTSNIIEKTVTLDKADAGFWEGYFYRIVYNVTAPSSNSYVQFTSAVFSKVESIPDATISGEDSVAAGNEWSPAEVVDELDNVVDTTGIVYSFDVDDGSVDLTSNSETGAFTASAPCTVTVSAVLDGYSISDKEVSVVYAAVTSVALSQTEATIGKGGSFDADDVTVTINEFANPAYSWGVQSAVKEDETAMAEGADKDYVWDGSKNLLTAKSTAGTITLRASSTADGTKYADLVVTITGKPVANLSTNTAYVYDGEDVTITASAISGVAPYSYAWSIVSGGDKVSIKSGGTSSTVTLTGDDVGSAVVQCVVTDSESESSDPVAATVEVIEKLGEISAPKLASTTYTFSSKSWAASPANWTSGKAGNELTSGRGVQVTSGTTGANATSPISFTGVASVVVTYSTNSSSGAGSIAIKVGTADYVGDASVTKTGGTTDRTITYSPYGTSDPATGNVKITVGCTTNSVYVKSVQVNTLVNEDIANEEGNEPVQFAALKFVSDFNSTMACEGVKGNTENVTTKWATLSSGFGSRRTQSGDSTSFNKLFKYASSVEGGDSLQDMLARYDYIIKKYNAAPYSLGLSDFLNAEGGAGRDAVKLAAVVPTAGHANEFIKNDSALTITLISLSASVIAAGGIFLARRRRNEE